MKCFGHVCFLQIFESFDGWYMYIMRNQSQRCFEGGVFLLGNFSYDPLISFASLRLQDSLDFEGFSIIYSSTKL